MLPLHFEVLYIRIEQLRCRMKLQHALKMLQRTLNLNYIIRHVAIYTSSMFNKCFFYMYMPGANFSNSK